MRPVSQLAPTMHHTAAPTGRQTRSRGPMEITSLFNQPSQPDAIWRKPATLANPVNTFTPITNDTPSHEDMEVASITGSTRLYKHSMGTGSGLPSGSGIQSENSAFSAYLRDSRMHPVNSTYQTVCMTLLQPEPLLSMDTCTMDMKLLL